MFDLAPLIKSAGYIGLSALIFAESGLLIGAVLPGDSVLFTAGILSSQGFLNIWILCPLLFISAVAGDSVGYAFGKRMGPKIFKRQDSLIFHKDHLERSQIFFHAHGGKTIIFARFFPFVRTFAPILAGVGNMRYGKFLSYNVIGGALWAVGVTLTGYFLGQKVPHIDRYLLPIILGILVLSALPTAWQVLRNKTQRQQIFNWLKKIFHSQ